MSALQAGLISVSRISFHPSNIGRDLGDLRTLVDSMRDHGVLVPVVLEKHGDGFRLRDGHRRVAAAKIAQVAQVPALVHAEQLGEADWLIQSAEANSLRRGLSNEDQRRIALRLLELRVSRKAIAAAFGIGMPRLAAIIDGPKPAAPKISNPRESHTVSKAALWMFLQHCADLGYIPGDQGDTLPMLAALIEGREWRTVDQAIEGLDECSRPQCEGDPIGWRDHLPVCSEHIYDRPKDRP